MQATDMRLALPADLSLAQDSEWCVVDVGSGWREVRFHDYATIYSLPGLYERLFHDLLKCSSPQVVTDALIDALPAYGLVPDDLAVLDVGAGNGIVGEQLRRSGVPRVVGVDILPEAEVAASRDRADVYEAYYVADLTELSPAQIDSMRAHRFNAMTCVAALGFGDIPTTAFARAYAFVRTGGLVAFNVKEDFLSVLDATGFGALIRGMVAQGVVKVVSHRRYRHRLAVDGDPLYYVAVVAEKVREIPDGLLLA